jgi:hypothetical protein
MAANSVLYIADSVTLTWAAVTTANLYHVQVSVGNPDFSGTLEKEDAALATYTTTFTDDGIDDARRYWRWRYSEDGGTTWSEWSETGSYWMNTGAANEITLSAGEWRMIDCNSVTDSYSFDLCPIDRVVFENIYRVRERNRLGTLLSEYVTNKARINLGFSGYIIHEQYRAFIRFNQVVKTFFLACYKSNETDTVPNIWKVQFEADPSMTMVAAGRPGLMTGSVNLMEV